MATSRFGGIPVDQSSQPVSRFGGVPVDQPVEDTGQIKSVSEAFSKLPGIPELAEIAAGANRSIAGVIDFLGPDTVNAALSLAGSEKKVPTIRESLPGIEGGFVEPGTKKDILGAVGETAPAALGIGQFIRTLSQKLPAIVTGGESTVAGLLRQAGQTTVAGDIGLGSVSAVGSEVGEDISGDEGALVGSILAPVTASAGTQGLKGLFDMGAKGVGALSRSMSDMSEDGASKLLAEAMVREGLSPEDVTQRLAQLGPESMPADVGVNFSRLLRTASNQIPVMEGRASTALKARQAGQGARISEAFDDASGTSYLNVDDEITRLNKTLKPKINELYDQARTQDIRLSERLSTLLDGDSSVGRAQRKSQQRLSDKRAAGDKISNIDIIDATKQEMDDQIGKALRKGENNKVRDLVRLKNVMVKEADESIPVYKQGRDLFAGKRQLENAAESGELFLKMKPRDVDKFVASMGSSEKKMFQLGAKQAILDKIDDLQTNADAVKRLFGKNGDVRKLRAVFDDKQSFDRFNDAMERESQFILTRNAAQANSTTAKQIADAGSAGDVLGLARSVIDSPIAAANKFGQIMGGLSGKRNSEAFTKSLEDAGDILLESGINSGRLQSILRSGNKEMIRNALEKALLKPHSGKVVIPSTKAAISEQIGTQ